jgi:hypothetical protein
MRRTLGVVAILLRAFQSRLITRDTKALGFFAGVPPFPFEWSPSQRHSSLQTASDAPLT